MIPKECKRLAEVDFPIAVVSAHASREKSIRHGHPSTLHLWWARRPLASCRAMLLALLLPDPCDSFCPPEFKVGARAILRNLTGIPAGDAALRKALLDFIGDVANWDVANHPRWISTARELIKAAHPEETPLVVDPFAGGGSIPLEALRLGCDAFASDLNPVACLINKVLLEDIPRHGPELAEELRQVGAEVKAAAEKELTEFYPLDLDGARPIAYLWARTVRCESPNCGAEIPLVRSFWLSKKANRRRALKPSVRRTAGETPRVEFTIDEPGSEKDVPSGTVNRAKATCLCCRTVLPPDRVRFQLAAQSGGADVIFGSRDPEESIRVGGARLLAVVTLRPREQGRHYRLPTNLDYRVVWKAELRLKEIEQQKRPDGLSPIPDEPTPAGGGTGAGRAFSVHKYGILRWGDLFTARQKVAVAVVQRLLRPGSRPALDLLLAFALSRMADRGTSICRWDNSSTSEVVKNTFSRQALPVVWDFAEVNLLSESTGNFLGVIDYIANVVAACPNGTPGQVQLADAVQSPLPDSSASGFFTDPPYYDAIPYSDLSDFFLVWLKRTLPGHTLLRDPFDASNPLSPKLREAVQDETKQVNGRPKDRKFFEDTMAEAFAEGRRVLRDDGIGSVVFAHKTTEGWEALLSGMIRGGWTITGSWPISTEMATRLRARDSAALATSVHLICRPRPQEASVGDWGEVLRELPERVQAWVERLEAEGVHGADLVFACIGPALEIFSRHARVESAEGEVISLDVFLQKVWEVVGRVALRRILGTDSPNVYGEDVRLTALFLWTYGTSRPAREVPLRNPLDEPLEVEGDEDDEDAGERTVRRAGYSLPYDMVRRFCQPLGIHMERWEGRLVSTHKGIVTLLAVEGRARQLLGGATAQDMRLVDKPPPAKEFQRLLFDDPDALERKQREAEARRRYEQATYSHLHQDTIPLLDHVHKAMLFQKQGQSNALRELLFFEMSYRPEFKTLANALSALYPTGSEEKRLLDAMLLAMPK